MQVPADKDTFKLKETWTGKDLYEIATMEGYQLFKRNLNSIVEGNVTHKAQKPGEDVKFYRRSQFPSHEIIFDGTGTDVYNRIRALLFPPFPVPYFHIGQKRFEIIPAEQEQEPS